MHIDCQPGRQSLNEEKTEGKVLICSGGKKSTGEEWGGRRKKYKNIFL